MWKYGRSTSINDVRRFSMIFDLPTKPLVCVRAHVRAHVRVRQFLCNWVRKDFEKCGSGCVRKSLFRCGRARARSHVHFSFFLKNFQLKKKNLDFLRKNVRVRVRKKWGAGACAAHYQIVCDVRAGVGQKVRSLKVRYLPTMSDDFYLIMSNFGVSFWTYLP